jgi:hypothetical protein
MSHLLVHCVLLVASISQHASSSEIAQRRHLVIRQLRRTIEDDALRILPSTAVAIATLVVAEHRQGQNEALLQHARGLRAWIDNAGGLEWLDRHCDYFTVVTILSVSLHFALPVSEQLIDTDAALKRVRLPLFSGEPLSSSLRQYATPSLASSQVANLYILSVLKKAELNSVLDDLERRLGPAEIQVTPGAMLWLMVAVIDSPCKARAFGCEALSSQRIIGFVNLLSHASYNVQRRVVLQLSTQLMGRKNVPLTDTKRIAEPWW